MAADHSTSHIFQSLAVNLAISVAKGVAAFITGSGALLAETLHSTADCGNQLLLLLGVKQARQAPDAAHPLGYGRDSYFWSFMATSSRSRSAPGARIVKWCFVEPDRVD